jgi:phosphatidylinositol glycan class B
LPVQAVPRLVRLPCAKERWFAAAGLAAVVVLAILLRVVPTVLMPSVVWPDEIFQASEQAHRLVYGSGLIPWEFQFGARSWLLPGVIAVLMELARIAGDGPDYYLPLIAIAFAGLAALPVACCFLWCRRLFGFSGAVVAGMAVATAPELVYFGARTLSEVAAGHLLLLGIYVLQPGYRVTSQRRLFVGGALLGFVLVVRVQLAPALLIVALWTNWRRACECAPAMLAGSAAALSVAGILDAVTLGYPLASMWRYVVYNLYYGASATFGVEPWHYYLRGELGVWGGAAPSLLLLVILGARWAPLLLAAAVTIIAVHSGIGHKEYRFIYPAVLLAFVLAGIGLAQLASWGRRFLERGRGRQFAALASAAFVLAYWCLASYGVWKSGTLTALRYRTYDNLTAAAFVAHGPGTCGIGLYGADGNDWADSGGYTYFHQPAPLYWPRDEAVLIGTAEGFDTLVYTRPPPPSLGFTPLRCFGLVCVARRHGGCHPVTQMPMPVPDALAQLSAVRTAGSEAPKSGGDFGQ